MTENNDWRLKLKEMHQAKPQDDSLELGDSWNEMPRPKEAGGNRTTGLYRKSVMPPLSVKNLYNIIIEKQSTANNNSKNTNSNEAAPAPTTSAPTTLIPTITAIESITPEEFDTINFSNYLQSKDNGTSTPFPVRRQNNINSSPKQSSPEVRKQAADSPNRNHLQVKSLTPISTTPLSSRKPNDNNARFSTSQKQRSIRNTKSSSPLVSSTVDSNENEDVQIVSPKSQGEVSARKIVENVNGMQSDKKNDVITIADPDEVLFRRPEIVQRPSQKQIKLEKLNDIDNESASEQSQPSSQPNNSCRHKNPERKVNALLESYKKVGESISNRTNSTQSQNFSSSTSSRRKLYKKGDSCNEDQIEDTNIPSNQCARETNVLSSTKSGASSARSIISNGSQGSSRLGATGVEQNDDIPTRSDKRTTESQRAEISNKKGSVEIQQNVENVNDPLNCDGGTEQQIQNHTSSNTNKLQNQHPHSSIQHKDFEENDSDPDSNDQSLRQKSVKQVLENILDDWSDSSTIAASKQDDNDNHSDSNDLEPPINVNTKKQSFKESTVRPVRSKNAKINVPPSKQPESRLGRSKEQQIHLTAQTNDSEDEDEILINKDEGQPSKKTQNRQIGSKKQHVKAKIVPENNSAEDDVLLNKNQDQLAVPPMKNPQSRSKKHNAKNVQANDSEDEILINKIDVPPLKNTQNRHVTSKKQHVKTKNVRENDSENDDVMMIENNEEIVVSPSKKSGRKQHIKTKNVQANDSEDEISISEDEVPPLKKTQSQQVPSKKQNIKTKSVSAGEDDMRINENNEGVAVLPSRRRQRGNQINTKNVQPVDSEDEELINVRCKEPKRKRGRPKKHNVNTKNLPENASRDVEDMPRNKVCAPPAKKPGRSGNPSNKQRANNQKVRENDSEEDDELSINGNDKVENGSSLKQTRSKNLQDVVVVPPSKNPESSQGRSNKQRIKKHIVQESDSDREDELITSSIRFDSSRNNDSYSEEVSRVVRVIEKKNPPNKSKARPVQLSDIEDNASNEIEERQAAKGKDARSKKNELVNKNPQPKKPQANKRHLDIEDEPNETRSNAKKKRLNVEGVSGADDFDRLKNGIDPIEDNTGESTNRNQLSKKPKQSRSRKRQVDTEERALTESVSQLNEQSDQLSEGSGSKTSVTTKPKRKKARFEVIGTKTRYSPLKEREVAAGTRHSTRVRRLPGNNLIIIPPRALLSRIAAHNTGGRNPPPPKPRRNENVETVYSMLLKGLNESVPPLVTNFHGVEIANGFHTAIKGNLTIHHVPGENGPSYGYFTLEPGAVKRACRISMKLHVHVVRGSVILIVDVDTQTELITGSFSSISAGTKYSLRNDGENQALLFFHQHEPANAVNSS